MLITLLVGTVVVITAGLTSLNKDITDNINSEKDEMLDISCQIDDLIKSTNAGLRNEKSQLTRIKNKVCKITFTSFTEVASNITNIEFSNQAKTKLSKIPVNHPSDNIDFSHQSSFLNPSRFTINLLAGPLIGELVYSFKLDEIKAKVDSQYAELKYESEIIRKECSKIKSLTRLLKTTKNVICVLNELSVKAIDNLKLITEKSGYDYSKYSPDDQNSVFITFKTIDVLNQLINKEIINKNGNIKSDFRKFIGEVNEECRFLENQMFPEVQNGTQK